MAAPSLSEIVLRCRERLQEGRERCRIQHDAGSRGVQVSARICDLYDDLVLEAWNHACLDHFGGETPRGIALVAHGGFGRRDLAPYSDADMMLITRARSTADAERIAKSLTRDLVDIGLDVGFAMRTPAEACSLSWRDPVIFTSLTESRFVAGSFNIFRSFFESLRRGARRRRSRLIRDLIEARRQEREKWGDTNYLLRPNVKKSRGGLRDIQMIRWIGFARYGEVDLERLLKFGALTDNDYRLIRRAYDFLIRLRNELHFREGRAQDVLDRPTQMAIADAWGYEGGDGMLPVETFMQEYFDVAREVRYASTFFADDNRSRPIISQAVERLLSKRIAQGVRMGPSHIWVEGAYLESFATDLAQVLRFMSMANHHRRRIGHHTWQTIREAMQTRPPTRPDAESIGAFLSLMSRGGRLAPLLRRLHELRIIEQLIPAFRRARGLLQFNAYHKYTVDAHCIRAVEVATDFADEQSAMGRRYRRLKDKTLLHLALLIHDIGKGYDEDHSVVGARIARETGELLELDPGSIEILEWLILKHLAVNTVAFRHDLSDPQIVLSFAKEVGSIRRLELLIVHSVADLAAVGPGVVTDWKMKLVEDLYLRTRRYFETGDLESYDDSVVRDYRAQVKTYLVDEPEQAMSRKLLANAPASMLRRVNSEDLAAQLIEVGRSIDDGEKSLCISQYDPVASAMRYTVVHDQGENRIGVFARVTGAFLSCGLGILRAEIDTLGDIVWDEFWVSDPDYPDEPPLRRIEKVCDRIKHLLDTPEAPLPPQRSTWSLERNRESPQVNILPTKVDFDNETLDRYTILSLFAYDRTGLLYHIARAFSQLHVVLHFAKIDTHLDQVADVFYVSEENGAKLEDYDRQEQVRQALLEVVSGDK
ncbi:[protein-PII] uridylyltransferase [Roseiconus nitratireducens]|uniref:Bifunctional uridylyltransferase/uridylyl-removing enzyme n=1 Tax=Roseiconus nitratireducens TaxID=2605748 RepID=A0A5M6DB36_9BACT|nr:[protein-PII] uridylyltransferase [Roseiconus nitratireducens]KAA5544583.1 [protein-PII] uridylyltransferase [Roseiconus nitratireducens]